MINISSFFLVAKIFGLAPYTLQVDVKCSRIASVFQRIPTFLMLLLYSTLVCSIFFKTKAGSEVSDTVNWIQFIPNAAIFFIVILTAENSRETIQSIGILIHGMDQKLKLFQVSFTNSHRRIKRLSLLATFLVIVCGSNIAILHFLITEDARIIATFYCLSFVIGKIGLLTFNFLFALYMMVLLERLRLVGKTIEWMIELPSSRSLSIKYDKNICLVNAAASGIDTGSEGIDIIYDIVATIQHICTQMNSYFGKKVIFTILAGFICLTVQLFYLINNIRHGFHDAKSVLAAAASCSLIFTHILELWVIFISGHRVKDMWSTLIKRVQDAKRKFAMDEKLKAQIDELVSIMVFTRVEIKAAGLFNIDLSVITSIVSSIATYLVVLVQFKMSEENSYQSSNRSSDVSQYRNQITQGPQGH